MQFSYGIEMMFKQVIPNLKHGNDGLIFTARNSQYKFGTDEKMSVSEDDNQIRSRSYTNALN